MPALFITLYLRELRLARRRPVEVVLPLVFCAAAVSLFPLAVGPEPQTLRQIAPGVVWACALLAAMLSVTQLYALDGADGTLEQMLLGDPGGGVIAVAKAAAHWSLTGLPLVLLAPLFGLLLGLRGAALGVLAVSLLLGTPVLSLLGNVAAALTQGLRSAAMLIVLLVLPLSIPALVFGTGAVAAVEGGQSPGAHYSLLGALLIFSALTALPATAAALRISME
ncbi:heme exporter protein CcmB [Caldimonas brevitalea]|uniref:Heme exporter protein B n=1 Tax=Caldimonas brevitalea TaxID=413882 RepID=A0A0G3BPC2_9BURK|nr:heme exporter protein CcmB [Caldimonas brevitalea]AKJ29241.1 heme ABC transporter permease [Caldimonas brevitalea]